MSEAITYKLGADMGNLFFKFRASSNGGGFNVLAASETSPSPTFNVGPNIDASTRRLSTCVRVTNERTGKDSGIVLVGDAGANANRRRRSTVQRGGRKGGKISNLPIFVGALMSVVVPRDCDEVVINLACSVLEGSQAKEVLALCADTYLVEWSGRVKGESERPPLRMTINANARKISPEGSAIVVCPNEQVLKGLYVDFGHGTTGWTVRNGSPHPVKREYEALGITALFEELFTASAVTTAGQYAGTGAATLAPLVKGVMDGSYKYGGSTGRHSFKADYRRSVSNLVGRYKTEFFETILDEPACQGMPLYAMGGGCNLPEIRQMIEGYGGTILTDIIPEVDDPQLLNAYYLHAAL